MIRLEVDLSTRLISILLLWIKVRQSTDLPVCRKDDVSPSDLLNDLLANDLVEYLEDLEDIKTVNAPQKERGKGIPLEQFVKKLAKSG